MANLKTNRGTTHIGNITISMYITPSTFKCNDIFAHRVQLLENSEG